ncbi:hypothetical protein [Nitrospina gracilis]|uniref:hypothetical protein n=1 Tax=Nitrospina gracilis TaxID=35801 RepID=UPI0035300269
MQGDGVFACSGEARGDHVAVGVEAADEAVVVFQIRRTARVGDEHVAALGIDRHSRRTVHSCGDKCDKGCGQSDQNQKWQNEESLHRTCKKRGGPPGALPVS